MSDIIDLDALVPEARKIKIGGKVIDVPPPKTVHILKLGQLGQKLDMAADMETSELEVVVSKLQDLICEVIPDLVGIELTTSQLMSLIAILGEMSTPKDDSVTTGEKGVDTDPKA